MLYIVFGTNTTVNSIFGAILRKKPASPARQAVLDVGHC